MLIGSVFSFFICNSYNISQTISALFSFVPFAPWSHNNSHSNKSTFHDWSKRNDIYLDPECSHIDFPYSIPPGIFSNIRIFELVYGYLDFWGCGLQKPMVFTISFRKHKLIRRFGTIRTLGLINDIETGRDFLVVQSNDEKNFTALLISSSDGWFLFIPPTNFQGP